MIDTSNQSNSWSPTTTYHYNFRATIWITTEAKKVTIATADADWQTTDWHKDIEILEGITFNIGAQLLKIKSPYA